MSIQKQQSVAITRSTEPCVICYDMPHDYIITECKHLCCIICYKQLKEHNIVDGVLPCPMCRMPISDDTVSTVLQVHLIPGTKAPPNSIRRTTHSQKGFVEYVQFGTVVDDDDDIAIAATKNHCAKNRKLLFDTYPYATAGSEPMRPPWRY